MWVSKYRYPVTNSNISYRRFNGSFLIFPTVFETCGKCYSHFALKKFSWTCWWYHWLVTQDLVTLTIQGVVVLVISNQPLNAHFSKFEINCPITPWIVLHSVQLLSLIIIGLRPDVHLMAKNYRKLYVRQFFCQNFKMYLFFPAYGKLGQSKEISKMNYYLKMLL